MKAEPEPQGRRALAAFTVELDVYSGPYEGLLSLILKHELEIFEVPLRELVSLYRSAYHAPGTQALGSGLERDADFVDSATSLVLLKGAEALGERFAKNAALYPSGHALRPRSRSLRVYPDRLAGAVRRAFLRTAEPEVRHLGPITVTVDELVGLIRTSLMRGPLSFEDLVRDMDRLRSAVAFAAALSLASEGHLSLSQAEPFGPLTLEPTK